MPETIPPSPATPALSPARFYDVFRGFHRREAPPEALGIEGTFSRGFPNAPLAREIAILLTHAPWRRNIAITAFGSSAASGAVFTAAGGHGFGLGVRCH